VSAASVAAIVGHATPAITANDFTVSDPATKQTDGISGVKTECFYGTGTAVFELGLATTSKPLSISQVESEDKASAPSSEHLKFTPYSGLGVPGFRVTGGSGSGAFDVIGGLSGKTLFTASGSGSLSASKLAALAKLARLL
jgi:hypothetical protein